MLLTLNDRQLSEMQENAVYRAHFNFLGVTLTLSSDAPDAVAVLSAIYHNFISPEQPTPHITCFIINKLHANSKPFAVVNGRAYTLFQDELFISHAHMLFFQQVLDTIDDHMLIHAGVVAQEDHGVIISGPSTYGKTTLMLELVSRGFKFFSDEFCPIKLETNAISAFPRSIGIRESNPFLKLVDRNSCLLMKNIGRGNKYLVNCDELFPQSRGSICKARYLILLRNKRNSNNTDNRSAIDLALFKENPLIIKEICSNNGIEHIETYFESDYVVYRFDIPVQAGLTKAFRDICSRHTNEIFYQELVTQDVPDYSITPHMQPITKTAAAFEVLKNLRNRSKDSRLLDKFNHKSSLLLLSIGEFLNDVDCYEMTTGPLTEMADMIESLYKKG
jgi:hypothetical protein